MLIILNERPVCPVPESARIDELYPTPRDEADYSLPGPRSGLSWKRFFLEADGWLRRYERTAIGPLRSAAYRAAEKWIVAHQEADGSWAGIQPPWVYSLIALKVRGYSNDHPVMRRGLEGLRGASGPLRTSATFNPQACLSPVWDTALAAIALLDGRASGGSSGAGRCGTLVAARAGAYRRRLAGERAGRGAGRLVVRVRERHVSGYGRHGGSADRPVADFDAGRAPETEGNRAREALARRDAVEERRLGRVRQGQHAADRERDPVLRLRRGDRPSVGGRHGARRRGAGAAGRRRVGGACSAA